MKPLARITIMLRRLAKSDSSFEKARDVANSNLLRTIYAGLIRSIDVENLAAMIEPYISPMSLPDLEQEIRGSLSAMLVNCADQGGLDTYELFQAIILELPQTAD